MRTEADPFHSLRVQDTLTNPDTDIDDALLQLSLEEIEEVSGELHLRLAIALRLLGEQHADHAEPGQRSPRWHVASLVAMTELAAHTLGAIAAGAPRVEAPRLDRDPATIGAVMYAAATIPALVGLLEQDRRRLASLARTLADRRDAEQVTPWGTISLRALIVAVLVAEPARCALLLERIPTRAEPPRDDV
jgi:hypothetical protein